MSVENVYGSESYVIMHEFVALVKLAVQDKVHMGVHQAESKNDNPAFGGYNKCAVHSVDEILPVIKQPVYGAAVSAEMPTIFNWILFSLDILGIQRKVRLHLPEQVIIYLHLHSRRLLWLLCIQI